MTTENLNNKTLNKKSDFNYYLPDELIAQKPLEPRDASRLMVIEKSTGSISHDHFYNILNYVKSGDCLILNDSKVLPARIYGKNTKTGANVEFLLLKQYSNNTWETLVKPGKKAKENFTFVFGDPQGAYLEAEIKEILPDGNRIIEFKDTNNFFGKLEIIGQMPLPPYIKEKLKDKSRYQTVYAKDLGSAAAPTAGLHFTPELLAKMKEHGVKIGFLTLHVGLGTFRPVKEENIEKHIMHSEYFVLPESTARLINDTKKSGSKVISVGTTSCRVLESVYQKFGAVKPYEGSTDIFIKPGYNFGVIDGLITNFHLPESTLIMLVSAFAGYQNIMKAYKIAVEEKYRFFSFGDATIII